MAAEVDDSTHNPLQYSQPTYPRELLTIKRRWISWSPRRGFCGRWEVLGVLQYITLHYITSKPALPGHPPLSVFFESRSLLISCCPTEQYLISNHYVSSMVWPATWTPHIFFTSTIIIVNLKPSSSSGFSIYHPEIATQKGRLFKILFKILTHPILLPPVLAVKDTYLSSHFAVSSEALEIGPELTLHGLYLRQPLNRVSARECAGALRLAFERRSRIRS